ncbi:Very-long-chain 3-oxoacyl-CoA reductase [Exaiptasia diaphana]|nr:Very-long-chain 3-oxoacyl-CoA reductase [Exaiptasia diaphana]
MAANILSVVGGVFLAYHGINFILQVIQGVKAFVLPSLGFRKDLKAFGSWAVVTGCTDGIGKSYAKQLAKQGLNIVLMSRNLEKLKKVEEEIRSEYNVETRIIVIDFSGGQEIYQDIGDKLKDLEIGILVNNVGVGVKCPDYFLMLPIEETCKMINVNILSVVMMTYIVLPMMVARKSGLVINVSSIAGRIPNPLVSTYSSTKLAQQGINIVLMSRNLEKLQKVEEEIRSEYNVETRIIVIDFTGGHEIYQDIGDKLKDLEIGILVNNVGIGIGKNDFFLTYPMKAFNEQINANDLSTVMITYIVLPIMVARKRGLIINISSILALAPSPFNATYPATKKE